MLTIKAEKEYEAEPMIYIKALNAHNENVMSKKNIFAFSDPLASGPNRPTHQGIRKIYIGVLTLVLCSSSPNNNDPESDHT